MRPNSHFIAFALAGALAFPGLLASGPAAAQNAEPFASENAILDTSIPFALGAREARQSLRGSFGWATFQEGLVEGVYFRFDPDGYARFSPSPRLDSDVFEVICRPRTFSCMGRKDSLSMFLTNRGQIQLKFDDVQPGDMFFVSEGISEIQIPERILQPLDHQMEALLATGGELIVRRGDQELANVSLNGYSAVVAYLRWILARQDYSVLPRGWPVPNSTNDPNAGGGVTQVSEWNSPMPQPQVIAPQSNRFETGPQFNQEVAEVRGELKLLRDLLLERANQSGSEQAAANPPAPAESAANQELNARLSELLRQAETIQSKIDQLQTAPSQQVVTPMAGQLPTLGMAPAMAPSMAPGQQVYQPQAPAGAMPQQQVFQSPQYPANPVYTQPQSGQMQANGALLTPAQAPQSPAMTQQASLPALADLFAQPGTPAPITAQNPAGPAAPVTPAAVQPEQTAPSATNMPEDIGKKLSYLIQEIGLDPQTAMSVLQAKLGDAMAAGAPAAPEAAAKSDARAPLYQGDVVSQILSELETEMEGGTPEQRAQQSPSVPSVDPTEYRLLTDYFKSVVMPELVPGNS